MTQQPGAGASEAEKEAVEWHFRLGQMPVSTETIHAFFAWRAADPENRAAYERVEEVWTASRRLAADPGIERLLALGAREEPRLRTEPEMPEDSPDARESS